MFKKKKSEEETMNLATKEEEILDSYTEEEKEENSEEYEEYVEEGILERETKVEKIKIIMNVIFVIILIILAMITIDVISVARYDNGPYFAIRLKKYNDGGTKEYYGIGYKVIKYNQTQGRRDKEVGFWSLKYDTTPITMQDIDLAIEMTGNEVETYQQYYKKFVRIISTLKEVDTEKHQITIGYQDEDGKYSLDIVCKMVEDQTNLSSLEVGKEITIIGTITDFKEKTTKKNNRLYISNCFAEQ